MEGSCIFLPPQWESWIGRPEMDSSFPVYCSYKTHLFTKFCAIEMRQESRKVLYCTVCLLWQHFGPVVRHTSSCILYSFLSTQFFPLGKISHSQKAIYKAEDLFLLGLPAIKPFLFSQVLIKCCEHKLYCPEHTNKHSKCYQPLCYCHMCIVNQADQLRERQQFKNKVSKRGMISLCTLLYK